MTKARAPMTFSLAITRIAGLIGWEETARISKRSKRTVRLWSESDKRTLPTLAQAMALDGAYIAAGGGEAPILESYARQMEVAMAVGLACQRALSDEIAETARESAEAIASSIRITQPGAGVLDVYHAIAETEEASGAINCLLGRLRSFLPDRGGQRSHQEGEHHGG